MRWWLLLTLLIAGCGPSPRGHADARLEKLAGRVTIIRDQWGIPHIYGKTDADAVFGLLYAQCEESFERVERAYREKLGRLAETEGSDYLYQDLKMRLLYDTAAAIRDHQKSPDWLKALLQAFSDGIRYYLQQHPEKTTNLRFEPWYPLLFTDGAYLDTQTGGLRQSDMEELFGSKLLAKGPPDPEPATAVGSNGFAIGPARSESGQALLYINPHVRFYFRTEVHLVSEEGLNAYGAVTWGQFFVFQGFNEALGWMHTSTAVDAADLYAETVQQKGAQVHYRYGNAWPEAEKRIIALDCLEGGSLKRRTVPAYYTRHGPVMGSRSGKWLSLKAVNRSTDGLVQSWQRMKATNLAEFTAILDLRANASTNTVYADRAGNIAYWHGNFVPKRPPGVDPSDPLDGSDPATEWDGIHPLSDLVQALNPASGFVQNCNSSPFSASGKSSIPIRQRPAYLAPEGENFRSLYALKMLSAPGRFNPQSLAALGYSTYLAAFDSLLPPLLRDLQALPATAPDRALLQEAGDSLRRWNRSASVSSAATTVAVFWAYSLLSQTATKGEMDAVRLVQNALRASTAAQRVAALRAVLLDLQRGAGGWKISWGAVTRFRRMAGGEEWPVGLGPAFLGSLASYETAWQDGRQYGMAGNSFVALVSFGKKVEAWSVSTGGQSFDPASPHFTDQVPRFLSGRLKPVYFYREDVAKHAERTYHPGEEKR